MKNTKKIQKKQNNLPVICRNDKKYTKLIVNKIVFFKYIILNKFNIIEKSYFNFKIYSALNT